MALGTLANKQRQPRAPTPAKTDEAPRGYRFSPALVDGGRAIQLYSGLMLAACRPLGPCFVSKLTF
jgi:hypothetical protein